MTHIALRHWRAVLLVLAVILFGSAPPVPVAAFNSTYSDFESPTNLGSWSASADNCVTQYSLTISTTHNHCPSNGTQAAEIKLKDPNSPSCPLPAAWMG